MKFDIEGRRGIGEVIVGKAALTLGLQVLHGLLLGPRVLIAAVVESDAARADRRVVVVCGVSKPYGFEGWHDKGAFLKRTKVLLMKQLRLLLGYSQSLEDTVSRLGLRQLLGLFLLQCKLGSLSATLGLVCELSAYIAIEAPQIDAVFVPARHHGGVVTRTKHDGSKGIRVTNEGLEVVWEGLLRLVIPDLEHRVLAASHHVA